jgi:hypothetical protein
VFRFPCALRPEPLAFYLPLPPPLVRAIFLAPPFRHPRLRRPPQLPSQPAFRARSLRIPCGAPIGHAWAIRQPRSLQDTRPNHRSSAPSSLCWSYPSFPPAPPSQSLGTQSVLPLPAARPAHGYSPFPYRDPLSILQWSSALLAFLGLYCPANHLCLSRRQTRRILPLPQARRAGAVRKLKGDRTSYVEHNTNRASQQNGTTIPRQPTRTHQSRTTEKEGRKEGRKVRKEGERKKERRNRDTGVCRQEQIKPRGALQCRGLGSAGKSPHRRKGKSKERAGSLKNSNLISGQGNSTAGSCRKEQGHRVLAQRRSVRGGAV